MNGGQTRRRRALLSCSDKTGLAEFARGLAARGFELISTGGTATVLRESGLDVTDVSSITSFPEIMAGRVKTLHPAIHGGLLGRSGIDDDVAAEHGISFIDLLVVNLYPFEQVTSQPDCTLEAAIETIDIGGPAMLRAAAKNHARVGVVVDAEDYVEVLDALNDDRFDHSLRQRLAIKAFRHTASYDTAISTYLSAQTEAAPACPDVLLLATGHGTQLRYGENPHQAAAIYPLPHAVRSSAAGALKLQGKELSYNNLADADAAVQCVKAFSSTACVIVKHANPCGVAIGDNAMAAYQRAYSCDATSAFGGVIAFNTPLDQATASTIVERQFAEVIVAPQISEGARRTLAEKPNIRVLELGSIDPVAPAVEIKTIEGAILAQQRDLGGLMDIELRQVSKRAPTDNELRDLRFAWTVAKFVKSNAIVYASEQMTIGVGAGQMSRVDSAKIAALKAAEADLSLDGAVMASDAFFPFRDAVDAAAERGIRAIIQPGGAMRDEQIIVAADQHDIAMMLTGMRHFRH